MVGKNEDQQKRRDVAWRMRAKRKNTIRILKVFRDQQMQQLMNIEFLMTKSDETSKAKIVWSVRPSWKPH